MKSSATLPYESEVETVNKEECSLEVQDVIRGKSCETGIVEK